MEEDRVKRISYSQILDGERDLIIDAIYEAGPDKNLKAEPLPRLLPKCGSSGGFRKVGREDESGKLAYCVLFTTMSEPEWPDYLDTETGVFRYYGDNRTPGHGITETKARGNLLLEEVFEMLHTSKDLSDMPPFLLFKKSGRGRDKQFLGLAVPGNPNISRDNDLVAFWRTTNGQRFQNYEAYFSILDTGETPISYEWLQSLIVDHENNLKLAPKAWQDFIAKGRSGIRPLKAQRTITIPDRRNQIYMDNEGNNCLQIIRDHYKDFPQGFEACAVKLIQMIDNHFDNFQLTRPWRDGGRDATGYYVIKSGDQVNHPLRIECALEAKCYSDNNSVGVKEMSRLISRIRYRQFGILVTTSYVNKQAYEEVTQDGHPILIATGADIAAVLRKHSIYSKDNLESWLESIDNSNQYKSIG